MYTVLCVHVCVYVHYVAVYGITIFSPQGISADIAAHEAAYEKVRSECSDLIGRGVGDAEELQQNLDNLQQRWNAVQVSIEQGRSIYMYT